jgi:hypothetical protein
MQLLRLEQLVQDLRLGHPHLMTLLLRSLQRHQLEMLLGKRMQQERSM